MANPWPFNHGNSWPFNHDGTRPVTFNSVAFVGSGTAAQPEFSTAAPPGPYTAAPPGPYTAAPPGPYTAAPPGPYTAAPPGPYTAEPPGPYTAAPPGHFTAAPPGHFTAAPPGHFTAAPPGHFTAAPPGHFTAAPPEHFMAAPPGHFMAAPPGFNTEAARSPTLIHGCSFTPIIPYISLCKLEGDNTQFGQQNTIQITQPGGNQLQPEEIYELDEVWQKDIKIQKGHPPDDIDADNVYKMSEKPRGHALIINNVDFDSNTKLKKRDGSDCDAANLESIFDQIHFNVKVVKNKKLEDMKKELLYLQEYNHSNCDALVVVILSHGNEDGVFATDGGVLSISEINNAFNDKNCPQLKGKPKLFFMMFCRGNNEIKYREIQRDSYDDACSDMLIAYSTKDGRVSYRNGIFGSIYGQFLVKSLEANAATKDIIEILEDVTRLLTKKKINLVYGQEPEFKPIGFDKKLYFRPFN